MSNEHSTIEDKMRSEVYLNAIKTCEELEKIQDNKIKKLEKQLEIATKALEYYAQCKHLNLDILAMLLDKHKKDFADFEVYEEGETARNALKEMEKEE